MTRDDFPSRIKDIVAKRAAYKCSNPECNKNCIGPATEFNKIIYIGKVAHITAASPGGPRYDASLASKERKSIENGIFLCSNCAELIDRNNGNDYSKETLIQWKTQHEENIRNSVKSYQSQQILNTIKPGYFSKRELDSMAILKDEPFVKDFISTYIELASKYSDYFTKSMIHSMAILKLDPFMSKMVDDKIEMRVKYGKKKLSSRLKLRRFKQD